MARKLLPSIYLPPLKNNMYRTMRIQYSFLILLCVVLISFTNLGILYLFVPGSLQNIETLIIEPKLSVKQISNKLAKHNIINKPLLFEFITKIYSLRYTIKSGEYRFTTQISPLQVLNILSSGKSVIHKFTVPEGSTTHEIISKINAEELLSGNITIDIPEGFLMPSTYFFSYGDSKERVIDQMRNLMSATLDKVMSKLPVDSPLKTRLEVLTLASIIEKESGSDKEKPIIASVFLNRLRKGMKLQADPTTIYAITKGKFKLNRTLTKKDLMMESPYNTYFVPKLPFGPIACPGEKSLNSIANPANTNELYFVVDGNGGHNFANNLDDHNKNVQLYKRMKEQKE